MSLRLDDRMWDRLIVLKPQSRRPLQAQIRELIVSAIAERHLPPGAAVPSTRELSDRLGIARNTVVLAYQRLVDEGLLEAVERQGYFVPAGASHGRVDETLGGRSPSAAPIDWAARCALRPTAQLNIVKPHDWLDYPHPFLYGQFDPSTFPIAAWRECCRQATSVLDLRGWAGDLIDRDDPLLIEQLRTKLLPRRGIWVDESQIMMTLGAQQAIYLLAELLTSETSLVGLEEPGYPDARNIFALKRRKLRRLAVDASGLVAGEALAGCDLVLATPNYQCPTTATMPVERREALLSQADRHDFLIIEDDYECGINGCASTMPALKGLDRGDRVIYVGSLSKTLAPGLRLGFIVGNAALIREARALRRLMLRHPPANNQRAAALFLALGHHSAYLRRLTQILAERSAIASRALGRHLPEFTCRGDAAGSSFWIEGPSSLDARHLAEKARRGGVLIEPGDVFFGCAVPPRNVFRLGVSSIPTERIEPGIAKLASVLGSLGQ